MKKYNKKKRYSILKMILRIIILGIAISALIISLQNRENIKWLEDVQVNIIEKVLFKND